MATRAPADVVVIGGGVIGLAVAWEAARGGMAVTVADPLPGRGATWAAAGMLSAERSFHRVKGCTDMATLVAGLARHAASVTPQRDTAEVA